MSDAPTATVATRYRDPATAAVVADAVRPDNTDDVTTTVDDTTVRTEVQRASVGSLSSSVDDYVVCVGVAAAVVETVDGRPPDDTQQTADDTQQTADETHDTRHHE